MSETSDYTNSDFICQAEMNLLADVFDLDDNRSQSAEIRLNILLNY